MTNNPAAAMRMLITYAIIIPLAIVLGYLAQDIGNRPDYSNVGFVALVLAIIISPIFIKWHYPILVFGVGCPAYCFFLVGQPPLWQVVALVSFGIAVVERALSSQRKFISPPIMVWPLLYIGAMVFFTAQMTGGIGLRTLGGDVGGGKKYIVIFCGLAMFFALTSRRIPVEKRNLYVGLLLLSGVPGLMSDLFPVLPSPLNYINLFFPPSQDAPLLGSTKHFARLGAFGGAAGALANFMLARYGLRGIMDATKPNRLPIFILLMVLTMLGGFRTVLISYMMIVTILFFMEGLHRTRLTIVFVLGIALMAALVIPFSDRLPLQMQRTMSFLPLKWDSEAVLSAQSSSEWRYQLWRDLWPKVPKYLLLGKGYALTAEDFQMMGNATFAGGSSVAMDSSNQGLAISGDYHSGPLSTLIPFGIWGAIGILWLQIAGQWVMLRNYRYGDPELKTVNRLLLVMYAIRFFGFFFTFGAFSGDVVEFAKLAGFSIALNWGVCKPEAKPAYNPRIKPLPEAIPQAA